MNSFILRFRVRILRQAQDERGRKFLFRSWWACRTIRTCL